MPRTLAVTHVAVIAMVTALPLGAQESTTRGFNLGLHLSAQSLTPDDGERQEAVGVGLAVGYGVNETVEVFLQIDGGEFDVENAFVAGTGCSGTSTSAPASTSPTRRGVGCLISRLH